MIWLNNQVDTRYFGNNVVCDNSQWYVEEQQLRASRRREAILARDAYRHQIQSSRVYGARQEQRAEQLERQQRRVKEAKKESVEDRAKKLLLSHLTDHQKKTFKDNGWFVVEGGKTKTQYRIRANGSVAGNVDEMREGRVTHRLCCHCNGSIPTFDHFLAQKTMLESAEEDFLRLANRNAVAA